MTWRGWARTGVALGLTASVAGNVAHPWAASAHPPAGAVVASVVWPLLLAVAIELLRVPWPKGLAWQAIRWGGAGLVATMSGVVSYRHMAGLLAAYGEDPVVCALGPLAVDGLTVMSVAALLTLPANAPADADGGEVRHGCDTTAPRPVTSDDATVAPPLVVVARHDDEDVAPPATPPETPTDAPPVAPDAGPAPRHDAPDGGTPPPVARHGEDGAPPRVAALDTPAKVVVTAPIPAIDRAAVAAEVAAAGGVARDLMARLADLGDPVSLRTAQRVMADI